MTGHAYATSARTAARMGPFAGYHADTRRHARTCCACTAPRWPRSTRSWCRPTCSRPPRRPGTAPSSSASSHGVRNSQASRAGARPAPSVCSWTATPPASSPTSGWSRPRSWSAAAPCRSSTRPCPGPWPARLHARSRSRTSSPTSTSTSRSSGRPTWPGEHLPVFACSMGDNTIHYLGHVRMMGAVQPFISGAISKTVNVPEDVTVEDVEQLHIDAWQHGDQGRRHLPGQLQGGSAAVHDARRKPSDDGARRSEAEAHDRDARRADRRARGGAGPRAATRPRHRGGGSGPRAPAPASQVEHVRLPGGRLRGLRAPWASTRTAVRARCS